MSAKVGGVGFSCEGLSYEPDGMKFKASMKSSYAKGKVTCNRSQVPAFNFHRGCNYDGGMKAFVESLILADGSTVTIVTPVTGAERGVSRVESQTGANNNVVVGTLIPLN